MKAIIHIGTEKTGTTSIQETLQKNVDSLMGAGFCYPKTFFNGNHTKIAVFSMEDDKIDMRKRKHKVISAEQVSAFRSQFEVEFSHEIEGLSPSTTVLIVNEHLSRLREKSEVERLRSFLLKYFDEIEVIIYLRRQDKLMRSMYSTVIKVGDIRENIFPIYEESKQGDFVTFDYRRVMDLWSEVFGRELISARLFERKLLHSEDVVLDFLRICGVPTETEIETVKANESLSPEALVALRELNKHIPKEFRENLGPIFSRLFPGSGQAALRHEAQEFLGYFEESNRYVAKKFFDRDALFDDIQDHEYQVKNNHTEEVTVAQVSEIFAKIYTEKVKQSRRALRKLKKQVHDPKS
ncbi:MAG: hypothetical protein ACRBCL_04015 [Maritimibacter sp.]